MKAVMKGALQVEIKFCNEMILKGFARLKLYKKAHMNRNLMNLQVQCRLPKRKQTIYCG